MLLAFLLPKRAQWVRLPSISMHELESTDSGTTGFAQRLEILRAGAALGARRAALALLSTQRRELMRNQRLL